ncbi:putative nicotinate-nucleotide--dimethylbenzimidazole phosphoribosyltransferase CobT [Hyphomonas neptunium ATCC 15444]|uniref:Nicotinate-nucleotide--dimethylbenzimidazole phosphoribosyltransferase n=2 Tax=Hyphomonas TaxID=85 RepID=Q0C220_HYPNA|nr:putative nicotinate-nucleotide--dimethylbenzimidazole phosphoribosyltransferase CobT [Hyphomonas neptunium ATCC 15444]
MLQTDFQSLIQKAIDSKTKPVGSLGRIEALAAQLARIQNTLMPVAASCGLTLFAGDHGMALAGVSAYPQAVTRQMVMNFLGGGAAANVFARTLGVDVEVVDCGVAGEPINAPSLLSRRLGAGTANAIERPAMTAVELDKALANGRAIGGDSDHDTACFGEMGIGNTSSASLVAAKILGYPVADLVGRGTGLADDGLKRKQALLEAAAGRTPDSLPADHALMEYGGFEIATMTGAMTAAAGAGRVVLVDGFIATVAALCARELSPGCAANFVYAHRSAEAGHARVLEALAAKPLLDLDMRLGEGTGALLAWPLVQAAAAMLRDMASFESAGVSGPA